MLQGYVLHHVAESQVPMPGAKRLLCIRQRLKHLHITWACLTQPCFATQMVSQSLSSSRGESVPVLQGPVLHHIAEAQVTVPDVQPILCMCQRLKHLPTAGTSASLQCCMPAAASSAVPQGQVVFAATSQHTAP